MSRQTGTIVTVVVALLTLCCSSIICLAGGLIVSGALDWADDFGIPYEGDIDPVLGAPVICLGLLIWVIPVLLAVFVARKRADGA